MNNTNALKLIGNVKWYGLGNIKAIKTHKPNLKVTLAILFAYIVEYHLK